MDDLNILIKAKIASTAKEMDTQIDNLSKKITSAISVKLKIDAKDLTLINDTMDKIKKTTQQTGGKITIFNEKDLKEQGVKYKQGVMKTIEDVEKYLKGAFNGKKFDLGKIVTDSSGNIKSFEASIKLANNQLEKVKFNLAEISRLNKSGVASTNTGYVLNSSQLSRIAVKPEQIFDRTKLEAEGRQFFFNSKNIIDRVKKEFSSLGEVNVFETLNSKSKLTSFVAEVTKANGVIEKLKFNMAKIQSGSSVQSGFVFDGERLVDKNAGKNLDTLKNKMQSFTNQLERMKVGFTSPTNGITDPQHLSNLISKYDQIKNTLKQVQQGSTNLSNEQRRGIVQNLADLRLQITQYKDLQRIMATSITNTRTLSSKDISLFQDTITNRLAGLQVGKDTVFAKPEIVAQMNRLTDSIARFGTVGGLSAKEVNLQFAQLTTSVRSATAEISRINAAADSVATTFGKDIFKLGIWSLAATILYSPFRALKDGLQYVYQMDTALTDLSKVVDFSSNQLNEMADAAINLGKQLGKSSVEIMQGMAEFGRVTKDQNEIIELTRVATMASNVTTLSSAEAAKAITSSMITFGIEAKDSIKILNSWNEVQNNFRVSAEDMIASISKIGAASRLANTDMEDLEGMTAAIVQSLGISGNEAGTAIKAFLSRIYRTDESNPEELGKTAKALKEIMNIDTSKANGELKSFNDLIMEIKSGWGEMSKQEQLAVAQSMGSTYHYSKFIALMENMDIKLKASAMARNSENSALDENAKKIDSISGRLGLLKVASEEFWASTINSNSVKEFVSALTYLVSTFANLSTVLALVATGLAIFKGTAILKFFKELPLTIRTSITSMTLFREISVANAMVADGLTTRLGFLGLSFRALGASIKEMFLSNLLGWLVIGITSIVMVTDIWNQKQEEAIQKQKESIEVYKRQQSEISSLVEAYKQNAELAKTDDNAKKQLLETEKKLKDIFGETAQGLDLQNGSIDKNIEKLNELDIANQKAFISEQKAYAEKAKNSLESSKEYNASSPSLNPFKSGVAFKGAVFKGTIEEALKYYKNLREEINKNLHGESLLNDGDTILQSEQISEVIKTLEAELKGYKDTILSLNNAYKIVAQNSISGLDDLSEKQKEVYDNVKDKLTFTNEDQYKKNLLEVFNILSKWDGKNIDDLNDKLHKVDSTLPPIVDNASDASKQVNNLSNSISNMDKAFKEGMSAQKDYADLLQKIKNKEELTADELVELTDKHKELLPHINETTNGFTIETDALEDLRKKTIEARLETIASEKKKSEAVLKESQERIDQLGLEKTAMDGLSNTHENITNVLHQLILKEMGKTGKSYGEVYNDFEKDNVYGALFNLGDAQSKIDEANQKANLYKKALEKPPQATKDPKEEEPVTGPYADLIREVAKANGISATLLDALIKQESGFRPSVVSPSGAIGLTQLMPATAKSLGVNNPYDPLENLTGGAKYLKQQLDKFGGDISLALSAYNAGPGAVQKYGGIPPYKETQNYVNSIMSDYNNRKLDSTAISDIVNQKGIEQQSFKDSTDAILAEANAQAELTKIKNEALNKEIEQAKSEKNYQLAIEKTNELIASQSEELSNLKIKQDKINQLKDSALSSASSQFGGDISRWFTGNDNQESVAYIEEYNQASEDQRKTMESTFSTLQSLRNAWVENKNAVSELTDAQKEAQSSLIQIHQEEINSLLDISKARTSLLENGTSEYNAEISKQISLYQELISTQDKLSAEYLNTQNTLKSLLTENLESTYTKSIDSINESLESYSKKLDETLTKSESRIEKYNSSLSNIDYSISLLQESDYTDKSNLLNDAINESSDKANRLATEFNRLSKTTVYSEEDADKLRQRLQELKSELQQTNQQTIEYVKTLEQTQFNQITSEAKLAQDEIDRLTSRIDANRQQLEGGMLSGSDLSFDFELPTGNTLDISSIINNTLDDVEEVEVKLDDSLQNQLENTEDHYEKMMDLINDYFKIILNDTDKYNSTIENGTETSTNNQYSNFTSFYTNLISLISTSMATASTTQKSHLDQMLTDVQNYANAISNVNIDTPKPGGSSGGSDGNTIVYDNGPNGWTEYDKDGNAVAGGTYPRYAKGTPKDGIPKDDLAIVSEDGQELLVFPNGKVELSGDNGAELVDLPKGTQVIPNKETEELLKHRSFANGTSDYEKLIEILENSDALSIKKVVRDYRNTIDKKANRNSDDYVYDDWEEDGRTSSTWIPMAKYKNGKITDFIETMSVNQVDEILALVEDGYQFVDEDMQNLFIEGLKNAETSVQEEVTNLANSISDILDTSNQTYQEVVDTVSKSMSDFQSTYDGLNSQISEMRTDGSSEEDILNAVQDRDYQVNENSFLWNDELLKAKEASAREAIDSLSEYMENNDLTEEMQTQINEEIQAQNEIINQSMEQRKQIVSEWFDYQQSLRDNDLQEFTDNQDDLTHEQELNQFDTGKQIEISEKLIDSEKQRMEMLKTQKQELQDQLSLYEIGSYEWNSINDQVEQYGELIEDAESNLLSMNKEWFDYQQSLRDNDLQEFTDYQDDIQHYQEMIGETDYSKQITLSQELVNSENNRLDLLKQQSEELKSHLSDYEVGSYEWNLINDQVEQYGELIEDAESNLLSMNKELLNNQFSSALDSIEKTLFNGQTQDEVQEALNDKIELQEKYLTGLEKELEVSKIKNRVVADELTLTAEQTALLNSQGDIEKDKLDRLNKELDIQEAQIKLQNLQNQKTIQQMGKDENGNWQFNYVADQDAIIEAQEDLANKQLELIQFEQDQQNEVDQEKIDEKSDYLNKLKNITDNAQNGEYASFDEFQQAMTDLNQSYLNGMVSDTSFNWSEIYSSIETNLDGIMTSYSTYVTNLQVLAIQAQQAYQDILDAQTKANEKSEADKNGTTYYDTETGKFVNANIEMFDYLEDLLNSDENISTDEIVQNTIKKFNIKSFDTGGATGNSKGLAWLDEKEIVLKESDTDNLLKSVEINRSILDSLKDFDFKNIMDSISTIRNVGEIFKPIDYMKNISNTLKQTSQTTENHFHIDKLEFPNVDNQSGIENLINGLNNYALQYSKR